VSSSGLACDGPGDQASASARDVIMSGVMSKRPVKARPESAPALTIPERILLFYRDGGPGADRAGHGQPAHAHGSGTGRTRRTAGQGRLRPMGRFKDLIEPMALGNMRANGVRSLDVSCWQCHHRAIMSAPDHVPVPSSGWRQRSGGASY
jgi:hypothetical protein